MDLVFGFTLLKKTCNAAATTKQKQNVADAPVFSVACVLLNYILLEFL